MDASQHPVYAVPALDKGLDILECLAGSRVPLSQAEMGRALQRSGSELFRMLNRLEQRGYLHKDPASGKYSLSLKLYALAHTHGPVEGLLRVAREPMRQLADETRESCHLSVLHGTDLLVLAQAESPEKVRISIEIGSTFPAMKTTSGRLLVSMLEPAEQAAFFTGAGPSLLRRIRKAGSHAAESELIDGVHDIAVPVAVPGVPAALAISWMSHKGSPDHTAVLRAALLTCAASISRLVGGQSPF